MGMPVTLSRVNPASPVLQKTHSAQTFLLNTEAEKVRIENQKNTLKISANMTLYDWNPSQKTGAVKK